MRVRFQYSKLDWFWVCGVQHGSEFEIWFRGTWILDTQALGCQRLWAYRILRFRALDFECSEGFGGSKPSNQSFELRVFQQVLVISLCTSEIILHLTKPPIQTAWAKANVHNLGIWSSEL